MRTIILLLVLVTLGFSRVSAQVTVELMLGQEEFLPGEPLPVTVKITNQSGQRLYLGTEPNYLTFSVESVDGFVVAKNSEVPVSGPFDLQSSQMGTQRVDLAPSFSLTRPGRYKITATLRIKAWGLELHSAVQTFDVITGAKLWAQDFGVPTNGLPEMRRFTLEQAAYLHSQMRLYLQVSDVPEARIYRTLPLGPSVSFSRPEAQLDHNTQLHVLWQSGAQSFDYRVVNPEGDIVERQIYDDLNTRPRLNVDDNGDVTVVGGVRRPKPGELPPAIPPPVSLPQATSAPTATK